VALYEKSEEEQAEAIKKWWKENGISVLAGVAIGVSLLIGWRWWQDYTELQAQTASMTYENMLSHLQQKKLAQAEEIASLLLKNHSNSSYAVLAQLHLAHQDLTQEDIESSHARLQWVIEQNSSLSQLTHIARLRKAKLFLSQDKINEAKSLIEPIPATGKFQAAYAELRGDIAVAEGQTEVARSAYKEALDTEALSYTHRQWVEMKLNDLGTVQGIQLQAPAPVAQMSTPSTATGQSFEIPAAQLTDDDSLGAMSTPSTTSAIQPLEIPILVEKEMK
jgi:predicted negative regulator of RcsB-dependent stress response